MRETGVTPPNHDTAITSEYSPRAQLKRFLDLSEEPLAKAEALERILGSLALKHRLGSNGRPT